MRGPREGLREDPALGRGGRGKGATPLADGWPPGPGPPSRPPPPFFGRQGASPGDRRPPPHSPPPPSHTGPRAGGVAPPPPPPPPPPHPPQLGAHRRGPPPPQGRGGAPTHRRNGDTVRATAAGPAPANPHRRAGATRTTEHEGGRAPHDPPVTTARSEETEGGFAGQLGPPGERSTGRHSPPPTPGRHYSPDRTRAPEGSAPATRREPERGTAGRRPERERGGRSAKPPPEARGMGPPNPRGEPECDPPPRSSRRPTWGPRRTSGPTPAHRDAAQIVPGEAG